MLWSCAYLTDNYFPEHGWLERGWVFKLPPLVDSQAVIESLMDLHLVGA